MTKTLFCVNSTENYKLPFFLHSVGIDFEETFINRPYGYPVYQWIQCDQGEGVFVCNNTEYTITPGTGMFIYPNVDHSYKSIKKPWITNWIAFDGNHIETLINTMGFHNTSVYNVKDSFVLRKQLKKCLDIATLDNPFSNIECSSQIYYFLVTLMKYIEPFDDESLYQGYSRLEPVCNYIKDNFHNAITIDELSNLIDVTPQYLCTLFKKYLQIRPFEYINKIRINESKKIMLHDSSLPISQICQLVGFDNPSYFGQQFKKIEGMTPGTFREYYV